MTEEATHNEAAEQRSNRRLGDKISVIILSKLATTSIDVITAIILVRMLVKDQFAILSLILVIYELARRVALFGYPESVLVFGADINGNQQRSLAKRTMLSVGKIALGVAVVIVLMSFTVEWWLPKWEPENRALLSTVLPLFALAGIIEFPTWPTTQILIVADREKWAGIYETATSFLLLACILVPIALGGTAFHLVLAVLAYAVIRALVSYPLVFRALPSEAQPLPEDMPGRQFRYAVPLGLEAFVGQANRYVDRFIIGFFLAEAAMANYHVAAQNIPFIKAIPLGFVGIMVPVYTRLRLRKDLKMLHSLWQRSMKLVSSFTIPVAIFLFIEAESFLTILFGEEYAAAALPFRIFTIVVFFRWAHFGTLMQAWEDSTGILRVSAAMLFVNLILNLPLTYFFGVAGAASATVTASLVGRALFLHFSRDQLKIDANEVAPYRYGFRVLIVGLIAIAPLLAWVKYGFGDWHVLPHTIVGAVIYLTTYVVVAIVTKTFGADHYRGFLYLIRMTDKADELDRV